MQHQEQEEQYSSVVAPPQSRDSSSVTTPPPRLGGRLDSFRDKWRNLSSGSLLSSANVDVPITAKKQSSYASASDIQDLLEEVDCRGSAILMRRPDHISVSYQSPPSSCSALSSFQYKISAAGTIIIGSSQNHTHHINSCALLDNSKHSLTYFDGGDVVEYACGLDCRKGRPTVMEIITEDDSPREVTVDLQKKIEESFGSDGNKIDTTICVSTTKHLKDPILLCQSIILFNKEDTFEIGDIGITFKERNSRLVVESVSKTAGWYTSKGCAIREGDIVVGINEHILTTLSIADAYLIIQDILSSTTDHQLSITTIATTLTTWDKFRKSAVAAGGGTLVASGTVLMATPLHPL